MSEIATDRMRKVKSILVTQEAPTDANSPYLKLSERFNVKIDFRPFIQVEPVPVKEFRKQKIDRKAVALVTQTLVDRDDPAFAVTKNLNFDMARILDIFFQE